MSRPSPQRLVKALDRWAVNYRIMPKWDDPDIDPYGDNFTPVGIILHHTAGVDSLQFCMRGTYPPVRNCHFLVGRDGKVYALAAGGCYHAGEGGPLTVDGSRIPEDAGNRYLYGIEIESLGRDASVNKKESDRDGMTPAQVESVSLLCNALLDAMGKPGETDAVIRHRDWAPRRKIDVLQPIAFWRREIREAYDAGPIPQIQPKPDPKPEAKPDVSKPKPSAIVVRLSNVRPGKHNNHVLVVQKALSRELGLDYSSGPGVFGPKTRDAYARWQRRMGYFGNDADGVPGIQTLKALGNKHGFSVVE